MRFLVIDLQTGEYPDLERIAETEEWAKGLDPSEMKGFHIEEDDVLCLTDNHGKCIECPSDRFEISVETEIGLTYSYVY